MSNTKHEVHFADEGEDERCWKLLSTGRICNQDAPSPAGLCPPHLERVRRMSRSSR